MRHPLDEDAGDGFTPRQRRAAKIALAVAWVCAFFATIILLGEMTS